MNGMKRFLWDRYAAFIAVFAIVPIHFHYMK